MKLKILPYLEVFHIADPLEYILAALGFQLVLTKRVVLLLQLLKSMQVLALSAEVHDLVQITLQLRDKLRVELSQVAESLLVLEDESRVQSLQHERDLLQLAGIHLVFAANNEVHELHEHACARLLTLTSPLLQILAHLA